MFRTRNHGFDREHAFGLALPQKPAFDFRLAHKRTRLPAHVDLIRADHRVRECDREFGASCDLTLARLDQHAARIRFRVRFRFFRSSGEISRRDQNRNQNENRASHSNSRMRFRSAFALSILPMRRWQFSRLRSASSVSPSFSERVNDSMAAGKSARSASSTPR